LSLSISYGSETIVVKYSERDCSNCALGLLTIANSYKTANKKIVFKTAFTQDVQTKELVELVTDMEFTVIFSDSLYYALGSGERSYVWLYSESQLRYQSLLSEFDPKAASTSVITASNSSYTNGASNQQVHLPTSKLRDYQIVKSGKGFAFLQSNFLVKHTITNRGPEILDLDTLAIGAQIYKLHIGNGYQDSLAAIKAFHKASRMPFAIKYYSLLINGDTSYVTAFAPVYVQIADTESTEPSYQVRQIGALVGIVDNRVVVCHKVNLEYLKLGTKRTKYQILFSTLLRYNSEFVIPVWKTQKADIGLKNALVGRFHTTAKDGLVFDRFGTYQLPSMHRDNKIGYNLLNFISSGVLVVANNDNVVYDVSTDTTFKIDIFRRPNNIDTTVFTTLSPSFNFTILDINRTQNELWILYNEDNHLYKAQMKITGNSAKLIAKTEILNEFPTEHDNYPALFIDGRVSLFNAANQSFEVLKD
jgi:hypothetical protein